MTTDHNMPGRVEEIILSGQHKSPQTLACLPEIISQTRALWHPTQIKTQHNLHTCREMSSQSKQVTKLKVNIFPHFSESGLIFAQVPSNTQPGATLKKKNRGRYNHTARSGWGDIRF